MIDSAISCALFFDAHQFFLWFVENANYWFVFLFMIIESSFIPFPSELVIPPAAYLAAAKGDMNIFLVFLAGTAGALVGALFNYYISVWIGRPIVYKFANSRFAHMLLIDEEKVKKAEDYFDEHGDTSTFIGRLIPVVRQLISIPAGIARMNIYKFILFTALGAGLWNAVLAGLGYWLGKTVPLSSLEQKIEEYNVYLTYLGIGILLACVAFMLYKGFFDKKRKSRS